MNKRSGVDSKSAPRYDNNTILKAPASFTHQRVAGTNFFPSFLIVRRMTCPMTRPRS